MYKLILNLLALLLFVNIAKCIKPSEQPSYLFNDNSKPSSKSIKIVSYAIKSDDNFVIKNVPVKHLTIEPFDNWVAKGIFTSDNYNTTGYIEYIQIFLNNIYQNLIDLIIKSWSLLEIETNEQASDKDQAFGAGLLEGYLSKDLINLHLINTVGDFCEETSETCSDLSNFLIANYRWIQSQIAANKDDPYWHQVNNTSRHIINFQLNVF